MAARGLCDSSRVSRVSSVIAMGVLLVVA